MLGFKEKIYIVTIVLSGSCLTWSVDSKFIFMDFFICLLAILLIIDRKKLLPEISSLNKWLYGFLFVILVTMLIRGTGFKLFGDENWGGSIYVKLIAYVIVAMHVTKLNIPIHYWKKILIWTCIFYWLPFITEIFYYYGIRGFWNEYIITPRRNIGDLEIMRFQAGRPLPLFIVLLSIVLWPLRKRLSMIHYGFLIFSIIIAGLSGHRIATIEVILFFIFRLILDKTIYVKKIFLVNAGFILLVFIFVIIFYDFLPVGLQRSFSFLPFTSSSSLVISDADYSTAWRIRLWDVLWEWIPQYFWIGKGVTFGASELAIIEAVDTSSPDFTIYLTLVWGFITGNYHNGPLSLIISFGVFGLLFPTIFLVKALKYILKFLKSYDIQEDSLNIYNIFLCIVSLVLVNVFIFFIIYGDLIRSLLILFLYNSMAMSVIFSIKNYNCDINK